MTHRSARFHTPIVVRGLSKLISHMSFLKGLGAVFLACLVCWSAPANAQTNTQPDLSTVWESDFGPIYWLGGYYGEPNKLLKGKLTRQDGKIVFEGKWGRFNDSTGLNLGADGEQWVKFTFSEDGRSFTGSYLGSNGAEATWNGRYKAGAAYSLGSTQPIGGDGQRYNGELAFQIEASKSDAGKDYDGYAQALSPGSRCTSEMVDFFVAQGLSLTSIVKLCRD